MLLRDVQSANAEASEVYDSDAPNRLEGAPATTLLPGRESEWRIGFGVADHKDLVMEVTPSIEHGPAIFTTETS